MIRQNYNNINEFVDVNNINQNDKYRAVINALNFNACCNILLQYADIEEYKQAFECDQHLNNIHNTWFYNKGQLPIRLKEIIWQWDIIGYRMLHNPQTTIRLKTISLSLLTCIAKECTRMLIEYNDKKNVIKSEIDKLFNARKTKKNKEKIENLLKEYLSLTYLTEVK